MNAPIHPAPTHPASPPSPLPRVLVAAFSRGWTYAAIGLGILLLDLVTGPYILFPFLFIIPVTLAAWFCSPRLAYAQAFLLPLGRFLIAEFVEHPSPVPYIMANALIRMAVLGFIAFLVSRTARQTRELQQRVKNLVTICAWSRTVEYEGRWISFEEYLLLRFGISTSHGISPEEARKVFGDAAQSSRNG